MVYFAGSEGWGERGEISVDRTTKAIIPKRIHDVQRPNQSRSPTTREYRRQVQELEETNGCSRERKERWKAQEIKTMTDSQGLQGDPNSVSNCCGARVTMQGLCSDCGEHCEDEAQEGPSDEKMERMRETSRHFDEAYRKTMIDAGRGHLLKP